MAVQGRCNFFKNRIYLAADSDLIQDILAQFHDSTHEGYFKTLQRLRLNFYWKGLRRDLKRYIRECETCQRNKADLSLPAGLLQPLPVPAQVWEDLSRDFVEGLPNSGGKTIIYVVVDRFSKYSHFMAIAHPYSAVHPEGKYVVDIDKNIDITKITPSTRVALRNDSYVLHLVLPSKVDPLVNLMKVEKVPDSTYDMIGGLDQQIKEIKEVIELPIKHPELFESLGIAQPKGVLLYGPPGTGKTLLARAVAHHTDCTFIRVSGSELVQKYIGEGSRMVRELFVMAREHAPSIIFMDEIDSIGSARMESGSGNGDSEVQRTMLELLNQLDGFEASNKIKVLMATNRIDILDQALLRPGRIDRKIEFPNPNEESRLDILKIHSRRMNLMRGIDLKKIAEKMNGASGAELKAVCTEAGMFALRERRVHVTQEDFEMAVAKVMKKETEKNMSLRKLWK
ncbi:26S proteasome regulatory subunit 8 homolog A-like isoform X1 [Gastrolobium bilobum]|uniref:26S proteasome regulatory subunit 8 homolog A-like isoform X1 n=1 Tax=Gastrolobium bilobum TaxID=150636 RepID=UPI002AB1C3AA|nr:26S proteasome regulatory subunit 8 homolog A-like isoform X1 [Gastrolobium bilobum]